MTPTLHGAPEGHLSSPLERCRGLRCRALPGRRRTELTERQSCGCKATTSSAPPVSRLHKWLCDTVYNCACCAACWIRDHLVLKGSCRAGRPYLARCPLACVCTLVFLKTQGQVRNGMWLPLQALVTMTQLAFMCSVAVQARRLVSFGTEQGLPCERPCQSFRQAMPHLLAAAHRASGRSLTCVERGPCHSLRLAAGRWQCRSSATPDPAPLVHIAGDVDVRVNSVSLHMARRCARAMQAMHGCQAPQCMLGSLTCQ